MPAGRGELLAEAAPHVHLTAALQGYHRIEFFKDGSWHRGDGAPGSTYLFASGHEARLRCHAERPYEMGHLYLPASLLDEAADQLGGPRGGVDGVPPLDRLAFHDPVVCNTIVALLAAAEGGAHELYAEQATTWLATHLIALHAGRAVRENVRSPLPDRRLSRAIEFLRSEFAGLLSLDRLAAEAGVSKFHFSRLFKEHTGDAPYAFVTRLRMVEAARLLRQTDLPIKTIASRCGYARPVQFSTVFRRFYGVVPTAYRDDER